MIRSRLALLTVVALCAATSLGAQGKTADKKSASKVPTAKDTMKAEAKISRKSAEKVVMKEVKGGKVRDHDLEQSAGKLVRLFEVEVPGKPGFEVVRIDAMTGNMVSHTHENVLGDSVKKTPKKKA